MSAAEQVRVRAAQQVLPVQVRLSFDLGLVDAEQPAGGDPQVPVQAGLGRDLPAQLPALHHRQAVGSGDQLLELGDQLLADVGVALRGVGVVADHEPLGVRHLHFLDPHVVGDVGVAALPRQCGLDLRAVGAQLLPDDVGVIALSQVAAVMFGGEPAVGDPHDLRQGPVPHVVFDLPDQRGVVRVAGPAPHPHRDPVAGHRHPDHDLGQVVAGVLRLAVGPEPDPVRPAAARPCRRPCRRLGWRSCRGGGGRVRRGPRARRGLPVRSRWRWCLLLPANHSR